MRIEWMLMTPELESARLVHEWRNDPGTLRMSFDSVAHPLDHFYQKFVYDYFLIKELPSLFIVLEGEKVGYIRFRPFSMAHAGCKSVEISINIAPQHRGKGIAQKALLAINDYVKRQGYDEIWAEIKPENTASKKVFLHAGYDFVSEAEHEVLQQGQQKLCTVALYCRKLTKKKKKGVFIIAEAGSNWRFGDLDRDLQCAEKMIQVAKEAGCDAIKFQTFSGQPLYVPNAGSAAYLSSQKHAQDIAKTLAAVAMPHQVVATLAMLCKKARIEFMSTPFSPKDFKAIDPYVKHHKIASYELSHIQLLQLAAESGKPLIISTGASPIADIAWTLDYIQSRSKAPLTLLQCTAQYPAESRAMNLRTIEWMRSYFQVDTGLSDHSLDPFSAPLAAIALGATVIEKHFTLDRRLPGPDHSFSLEPDELSSMVARIREVEVMLGEAVKKVDRAEEELFYFAKRGIQATRPIKAGDLLKDGKNISILRPGNQKRGIHPRYLKEMQGKRATRSIALGEGIQHGDWA